MTTLRGQFRDAFEPAADPLRQVLVGATASLAVAFPAFDELGVGGWADWLLGAILAADAWMIASRESRTGMVGAGRGSESTIGYIGYGIGLFVLAAVFVGILVFSYRAFFP